MHGGGAWRRYLLPVFLTLLNSAPSVEYRLKFFFFESETDIYNKFHKHFTMFFPTFNRPFCFHRARACASVLSFFRSQRKPGQQLMFKTNIETKKRALCLLLVVLHRPLAHPRVAL